MIEIRDLHKSFGSLEVLKGIDLTLERGKVLAIIGPSGSGKTTLLRCFNLLEVPDRGKLTVGKLTMDFQAGKKIREKDAIALRKVTGMVFQSFNLFPHKTAIENIMEAQMTVQRKSKSDSRQVAAELLAKVGLADKAEAYPHQLSGGQQQRIAIARAMAVGPEVLLFDEPTSALDPELVGEVLKVIKQLAADGMTMIIVTHEMAFARDVADRVCFLDNGRILEEAPPSKLFSNPENPRTRQFLQRIIEAGRL